MDKLSSHYQSSQLGKHVYHFDFMIKVQHSG